MPPRDPVLETFAAGWANHQTLLLDALGGLDPDRLALRTAPHEWAIWQIAGHVAGSRAYWFHDVLGEGDESHPRDGPEIVDALERTWTLIDGCLQRWSLDDLTTPVSRSGRRPSTRAWVIWHLIEHDAHHGGAISLILGTNGLAGLDL